MDAVGTEKERAALVDFLNFLETLASMLGESLLPRATRLMVRSILIEAISMIRANSCMHDVLMDSATSPLTYRYLVAFEKKHRRAIERQLRLFAKPAT